MLRTLLTLSLLLSWNVQADKFIKIVWVSDIDFGTATQGDPAKTVSSSTMETDANGSFEITGKQGVDYSIALPTSITMTATGGSGGLSTITVSNFTSYPSAGNNGFLGPKGRQVIFIGATRAAIANNQRRGAYAGTYSVTVLY